jgi:hypothetical protein
MVLLAGSISRLEFSPGQPFALEEAKPELGDELVAVRRLSPKMRQAITTVLSAIYIAGLVYLPFALIYMVLSPQARREALRKLAPLLLILVIYLLMRSRPEAFQWVQELPFQEVVPEPEGPVQVFSQTPPNWLLTMTNVGLGLLFAAAIAATAWFLLRRRERRADTLEQLAQGAQDAIEALYAGADLKDTILRCYFEMSKVLSQERGITREEAMTPREFERHLEGVGLPPEPIQELTRLFERVRYGAKVPGEAEERQAIRSLTAVVEACHSVP